MMYSGLCLIAFFKRSKSVISLTSPVVPNPILTTLESQFSCGSCISAVSSMETILAFGLMNMANVLIVLVLLEAVAPTIMEEACFSMLYHYHADIAGDTSLLIVR